MFLGLSGVNPSSTSCGFMVVKIKFPGCQGKDLDLDVNRTKLVAQSPELRLDLSLPHAVNDKDGTAKWDVEKETLSVTLPIIREDPF